MANPLTLLMPLAEGADLTKLAETLESNQAAIDNALTSIGTVHFARFLVFDRSAPNLQVGPTSTGPFVLAVITEYDNNFDLYIQDFVSQLGDVFNALLPYVTGTEALIPVQQHLQEFTAFVQANDASQHTQFSLYSAYPYSVQQILANG